MAQYDHLKLVRLPEQLERRKKPGFGAPYARERGAHSAKLSKQLDIAVSTQQQRRRPSVVTPSLVLRVQTVQPIAEKEWAQVGLAVLSTDSDRTLVLFSSTDEMQQFRERIAAYGGTIPEGQKNAPYANFVSSIEVIGAVEPRDRIGLRLREAGFVQFADFTSADRLLDLELWDVGDRAFRQRQLERIATLIKTAGGEVYDQYLGPSLTMLRFRASGELIRSLLAIEDVACIDLPPEPDVLTAGAVALTLQSVPTLGDVDHDAPVIGIIDSGVNQHPFLEAIIVGSIAVPESLGQADTDGHGTRVAGIAAFGDFREQLYSGTLTPGARICSARVLNDNGNFDDKTLVPSQMRKAITELHEQFGCRIFVISLGDRSSPWLGGKVGPWAATLDGLARELDILIFVSAGNRTPRCDDRIEEAVTHYPRYLLEESNGFFEPAGAVNVIAVGALAHSEGVDVSISEDVFVRPIARRLEPAPFTRVGPGVNGAAKPDVVDFGGTMVFDAAMQRLRLGRDLPSAGVLTLHNRPLDQLFASGSGTSYAAPLAAFKASQLMKRFPGASANLLRALLIGAARIPDETLTRLPNLQDAQKVCGHGHIDLLRAAYSDDSRVVLVAEGELQLDHFAVYEIPLPDLYQSQKGRRTIRVTLAFDPPVRHTRMDYAGVSMSFRLNRGCKSDLVFEHYRKRTLEQGPVPDLLARYCCKFTPGSNQRDNATVQTGIAAFDRDISKYGSVYYLVVRCEAGWAASYENAQRFAVVVELQHQAEIQLYDRLRVRRSS